MADVGTGTTLTFGTSSYAAQITAIAVNGQSRPAINVSHLGTTGHHDYIPGDLIEGGEVAVDILLNPDTQVPLNSASETVTLTAPIPSGGSAGATWVFPGFFISANYTFPMEDKMVGNYTVKVAGDIVFTDHS